MPVYAKVSSNEYDKRAIGLHLMVAASPQDVLIHPWVGTHPWVSTHPWVGTHPWVEFAQSEGEY